MYKNGGVIKQDKGLAYMWYRLVADQEGNEWGVRIEQLKNMTPEQIAEAKEMAKKCREQNYKNCDKLAVQN